MSDSPATSPSSGEKKFMLHDFVWGKVKGFSYWPGQICEGSNIKCNRKLKNPHCVFFFGSNNYAWLGEESIKPYEEYREQYSKLAKTLIFKNAIAKIEEKISSAKGKPLEPLLNVSSPSNTSLSTPETVKSDSLFKTKKANTAPIQRDYSRTPFKKEKRNYENSFESEKKTPSKSSAVESVDKKRAKVSHQPSTPKKVLNSSPKPESLFKESSPEPQPLHERVTEVKSINKSVKSKASSLKFGFIGLGKMGQSILRHLLNAGHDITIFNRTPSKCKEFEKLGAVIVKTPGDVVRESDITFSCLSDAKASQSMFFGNCGVIHEINASKGYVELTSIDFVTSLEIEASVRTKGGRYLEAPVLTCSIPKQIEEGKLVAMVSGNRSLFDDCGTCFEAICSHVYFLSESAGIASKMNIVVSTLYGNIVGSLIECMNLVERLGLIQKDFVEILSKSALRSPLIESKIPSMVDSTLIRDIPIDHIRRDLNYCLSMANTKNFTTPITATTNEVFKQKKHHFY